MVNKEVKIEDCIKNKSVIDLRPFEFPNSSRINMWQPLRKHAIWQYYNICRRSAPSIWQTVMTAVLAKLGVSVTEFAFNLSVKGMGLMGTSLYK